MSSMELNFKHKDFHVVSVEQEKGNSKVTITRNDELLKEFLWPTYKIFNIQAHIDDIIEDIESGLRIAGSNGLGGGCY